MTGTNQTEGLALSTKKTPKDKPLPGTNYRNTNLIPYERGGREQREKERVREWGRKDGREWEQMIFFNESRKAD